MQLILEMLMPTRMMLIFGFLTFRNVRQQRQRTNVVQTNHISVPAVVTITARHLDTLQQPTHINIGTNNQSSITKANRTAQKRDAQLITMLLVQVNDREKDSEKKKLFF